MKKIIMLLFIISSLAQGVVRELNKINWMEFRDQVPLKINTILLPVGTVEAHGVTPNGTDNYIAETICYDIAKDVNAMIAPTVSYGVTGSLRAFPGSMEVKSNNFKNYVLDIVTELAKIKFKNIIIMNGHGATQTDILNEIAKQVSDELNVRIMVINWWNYTLDITKDVYGESGGHAGNNETGYMITIMPERILSEKYNKELASPYPPKGTWTAFPFPSSIGLYEPGQGYPDFDKNKAKMFREKVNNKIINLINDVIDKWNKAGLNN